MADISVKIKNHKCFLETSQGFDILKPVNVLIGKNNCGKSSLLDLIQYLADPKSITKNETEIIYTYTLEKDELKVVFHTGSSGGPIQGNHWEYGQRFINNKMTMSIGQNASKHFVSLEPPLENPNLVQHMQSLCDRKHIPLYGKRFKRLRAERDIVPENDNDNEVYENGRGATNIIQRFINKANLPSDLVEKVLLKELNKICNPDVDFKDIVIQQLSTGSWEICLEEEHKGRIALSQSGSGLKTIILVLIFLLLIPKHENKELKDYVFAFEELENNIHPALQRRLFLYLREVALTKHAHFFLTTHSNIVIDLFSNDPEAQIYHVIHDGKKAISNPVKTYIEKAGILDDLDVRASDLLQSNGVIWVEGPSDRLYVNRWIELWSEGKLREGAHYQCVFYGGRLLAHLSADIPEEEQNNLIKILLTNRNAMILMDSDKRSRSDPVNNTKKRIEEEIEKAGCLCWVTKGREVENYIPTIAVKSLYGLEEVREVGIYEPFNEYLESIKKGEGQKFASNKVLFAEKIRSCLNRDNLSQKLDLKESIDSIIARIKKWNAIN